MLIGMTVWDYMKSVYLIITDGCFLFFSGKRLNMPYCAILTFGFAFNDMYDINDFYLVDNCNISLRTKIYTLDL